MAPRGSATRPTADRVREALFSILFDVQGLEVLDLYAGTGALGIEALSRGAARATFVENARAPLAALDRNLEALRVPAERREVRRATVARALGELARAARTFDLVFADPPYADAPTALPELLRALPALLTPGARVVLELAASGEPPVAPQGLAHRGTRRYGETALAFYEAPATGAPPELEPRDPPMLTRRSASVTPSATLALAQKARDLAAEGRDVVSLTTGEPDFPVPPHIVEAMKAALDGGQTRYTAVGGVPELREAIAQQYRAHGLSVTRDDVVVSTGAKQSLFNAVLSLLDEGDEAIVVAPYWLSYADMVRFAGAKLVTIETRAESGFLASPADLERALSPRTRVLFLNSPSNPAGAVYDRDQLGALADVLERHPSVTVISDEIYDSFVYGDRECPGILDVAPQLAGRVLVINGCSKRYAMTGLRIGWAVGPRPLISAMTRLQGQSTSNPNTIAQAGALAAITGDQSPVARMVEAFDARRKLLVGRLNAIPGVSCFDPPGAFYVLPSLAEYVGRTLPDGSRIDDAYAITAHLLHDHALVVVPGGPFGAPNHIRISFATDMETLSKGVDRLRAALLALG